MPSLLPHVTILLCTANGARFLEAQLASYLDQSHRDWSLWVSDDGSRDGTLALVEAFRAAHGDRHPVRLVAGPQKGAAANFMSLLCHPDLPAGVVALSDQDDIWQPGKLERALGQIAGRAGPVLYGAQSLHVEEDLRPIGPSRVPPRPPDFRNALIQNIVSGHSAVLNPPALALVRRAGIPEGIEYHDWWLYQLLSGAGAGVVIDDAPVLFYRQHGHNLLGAHRGWRARAGRAALVVGREYGRWMAANVAALTRADDVLTPENRAVLAEMRAGLHRGPPGARRLMRAGLHRQTRLASSLFYLAAFLGRI